MDNASREALDRGLEQLALPVDSAARAGLGLWFDELLKWNARVNLTSITEPAEVVEKHLLDSLAALPEVAGATSLLDLGAGAGLPGIPLALALPGLHVTLVDAVNKKVAFLKQVVVRLGLQGRVRAVRLRAAGKPAEEGLEQAEVVVSRALMDLGRWLPFALPYLAPGGRLVAMLARRPPGLDAAGASSGLRLASARELQLPFSKDPRCLAVFVRST